VIFIWAYLPAINAPFLFDDTNQRYTLPDAAGTLLQWIASPVRPMLMFTYWANVQVSRTETLSYHAVNLAIHALAAFFVFLFIRRLLEWSGRNLGDRYCWAGFGAALFLLHPLQTESVAYIAGRSEALSGMFAAACIAAFVYRRSTAISWPMVLVVLALFGAAILSKEQAIVVPAVLLLTDFWWDPSFSLKGIFRNWKLYGLMAAGGVAGMALFWRLILGQGTGGSAGFGIMPWYQYLFTQFRALWVYIGSFVLPASLNVDWEFDLSRTIFEHAAIVGLVGLFVLAAAAWRYRERFRLAGYGYFLFLVFLLPTSSVLPIKDPVADRRMYLPMIGLTLIAIEFLSRWRVNRRVAVAVAAAILLAMSFVTHARAEVWSDPLTLWQDTVAKSPGKSRPHFQLAQTYAFAQRYDLAVPEFEKTAALAPPSFDLLLDMGLAYDGVQQYDKAIDRLRQALAFAARPNEAAHVQTQIGKVYADQRNWPQAMAAFDAAEKADPNFATTYVYKGLVHLATNDPDGGLRECRRAIAIDPSFQPALDCVTQAQKMGAK
jgi:tetratricopeptide (TPR) repeat protein